MQSANIYCKALRLNPGDDLTDSLVKFVKQHKMQSAFILTCVGSITKATLRLANACATNKNEIIELKERHEIVSLVGTICLNGSFHLHTCLSDKAGNVIGGHVVKNMKVFTTAEIVIGTCHGINFTREFDVSTGFDELVVHEN